MDDQTVTRQLPVELTAGELRERALELAEKIAEGRQLESRRKESAGRFKADDDKLRTRADVLSEAIKSGRENRETECRWSRNDTMMRMELVRMDSGEVIESRPLTHDERQVKIFPTAVPNPKTKKGSGEDGGN